MGRDLEHVSEEEESDEPLTDYIEPLKTYEEQESRLFTESAEPILGHSFMCRAQSGIASGVPCLHLPCT